MFNVGPGELLVILLVALIVLGPQRLPQAAKTAGKVLGELRQVSSGFQNELRSAMDDASDAGPTTARRNVLARDNGAADGSSAAADGDGNGTGTAATRGSGGSTGAGNVASASASGNGTGTGGPAADPVAAEVDDAIAAVSANGTRPPRPRRRVPLVAAADPDAAAGHAAEPGAGDEHQPPATGHP